MSNYKEIGVYRYLIKSNPIGSGSYGTVMKGFHSESKKPVAIKIITLLEESNFQVKSRMLDREIEIISKLNHPNIIKLLFYQVCFIIVFKLLINF